MQVYAGLGHVDSGRSYLFYFLFIDPRIKHRAQVGEVENGQEAEDQVQQHYPVFLQTRTEGQTATPSLRSFSLDLVLFLSPRQKDRHLCADYIMRVEEITPPS